MATAYYDIITIAGFTPYVGAGIGFADNHTHNRALVAGLRSTEDNNAGFAWQATTGVSYNITPNWSLDFGYRYVDMGTVNSSARTVPPTGVFITGAAGSAAPVGFVSNTIKGDLQAHEVAVGLRYSF